MNSDQDQRQALKEALSVISKKEYNLEYRYMCVYTKLYVAALEFKAQEFKKDKNRINNVVKRMDRNAMTKVLNFKGVFDLTLEDIIELEELLKINILVYNDDSVK